MDDLATKQIVEILGHMLDNQIPLVAHQMQFQLPVSAPGEEPEMVTIKATVAIAVGTLAGVLVQATDQIVAHVQKHNPDFVRRGENPDVVN
jgi:hypothetical protein